MNVLKQFEKQFNGFETVPYDVVRKYLADTQDELNELKKVNRNKVSSLERKVEGLSYKIETFKQQLRFGKKLHPFVNAAFPVVLMRLRSALDRYPEASYVYFNKSLIQFSVYKKEVTEKKNGYENLRLVGIYSKKSFEAEYLREDMMDLMKELER